MVKDGEDYHRLQTKNLKPKLFKMCKPWRSSLYVRHPRSTWKVHYLASWVNRAMGSRRRYSLRWDWVLDWHCTVRWTNTQTNFRALFVQPNGKHRGNDNTEVPFSWSCQLLVSHYVSPIIANCSCLKQRRIPRTFSYSIRILTEFFFLKHPGDIKITLVVNIEVKYEFFCAICNK